MTPFGLRLLPGLLLALFSVVFNSLVLLTFAFRRFRSRDRRFGTTTSVQVLTLTILDFLVGVSFLVSHGNAASFESIDRLKAFYGGSVVAVVDAAAASSLSSKLTKGLVATSVNESAEAASSVPPWTKAAKEAGGRTFVLHGLAYVFRLGEIVIVYFPLVIWTETTARFTTVYIAIDRAMR